MIRVAIIEDEEEHAKTLQNFLKQFEAEANKELDIVWHQSSLSFMEEYKCQYDVLFCDIKMPGIDGMKLTKQIREIDPNVVIVFTTSLAQYAIEGYTVNAVDYILKPFSYGEFKLKMTRIFTKFLKCDSKYVLCQKDRAKYKINVEDIYYIETNIHQVIIHCERDVYNRYCSMNEIEKDLSGLGFIKINSCYLVNTKIIESVHKDECRLKNGKSLKISRSHVKEINEMFK